MNLTNIGGYLDIGYNALYTDDPNLRDFLGLPAPAADWNWEQTQTVAPEGVAAMTLTATSVEVSYTPIEYDVDPGGYVVYYGMAPGGPYPYSMTTTDKTASSLEITGLEPGNRYHFKVQTRTDPHIGLEPEFNNQNTVLSELTEQVSADTPIWADLSVTKVNDPGPVTANETLSYTVTVQNAGPSPAPVSFEDPLPSGLDNPEYSINGGAWNENPPPAFSLGSMASGASHQILFRADVSPAAFGTLTNTVTVKIDKGSQAIDPNEGNNSATVENEVVAAADLVVMKTGNTGSVTAGEALAYTIKVQNQGPSSAHNTTLTDTVPADLLNAEYSTDGGQAWNPWAGSLPLGTIDPAGSQQILLRGTVSPSFAGTLSNTAEVSSDVLDPVAENNSATQQTTVQGEADLSVTKMDDGYDPTLAGNILTYSITVQNQGPSNAVDVTLTDTKPSQLLNLDYSTDDGQTWNNWSGSLNLGIMGPGSSAVVLLKGKVDSGATGTISNTASVGSTTTDPLPGNNTATQETTIETKANLGITKEDSTDPILSGHVLTYTITVENSGPSDALNVMLTDDLPSELQNTQYSTDGGQAWSQWNSPANLGTVGADTTQQVLIKGTLIPSANGTLSNTASVESETPDPISENDSDTETTRVVVSGDMNGDGEVDLSDALFVCQILCDMDPGYNPSHILIDLDGDGVIGWGELLFILQTISESRP
jgi:uncharacterized repeat protein (TIGR01451 family)